VQTGSCLKAPHSASIKSLVVSPILTDPLVQPTQLRPQVSHTFAPKHSIWHVVLRSAFPSLPYSRTGLLLARDTLFGVTVDGHIFTTCKELCSGWVHILRFIARTPGWLLCCKRGLKNSPDWRKLKRGIGRNKAVEVALREGVFQRQRAASSLGNAESSSANYVSLRCSYSDFKFGLLQATEAGSSYTTTFISVAICAAAKATIRAISRSQHPLRMLER
jgi:hypothetical protein